MSPGNIMLSEISHIQKDRYCVIPLIPRVIRFTDRKYSDHCHGLRGRGYGEERVAV